MQDILQTPRLNLRELADSDLDFLFRMLGNPVVMRFYPHAYSPDETRMWLQRQQQSYENHGHGIWLVEHRPTGIPLGLVGLLRQAVEGAELYEVGYLIDEPQWQQGYASEAAAACQQYAFEQYPIDCIHSLVRPINIPSQRTALKTGMKPWRFVEFKGYEHILFGKNRP